MPRKGNPLYLSFGRRNFLDSVLWVFKLSKGDLLKSCGDGEVSIGLHSLYTAALDFSCPGYDRKEREDFIGEAESSLILSVISEFTCAFISKLQ